MSLYIPLISDAIGLVREILPDGDERARLENKLAELKEQVYITELQTKTIPWVDAIHKMGRQILSLTQFGVSVFLLYTHPDIDPLTIAAINTPGGIYNWVKGKGR